MSSLKPLPDEELPSENTVCNMLNRMGHNLKRVLKARPEKKIKQADETFENVGEANRMSDDDPESLRISTDAKAGLNAGEFSRGGKSRDREAGKATDHDMNPKIRLVPYGILNVLSGLVTIFFWGLPLKQAISQQTALKPGGRQTKLRTVI